VKWRFSAPAGDVEGSKLCLFSVIMPAKCVSSISPRFHYRRVTFCFLPLAAILESHLFLLNQAEITSSKTQEFGHIQKSLKIMGATRKKKVLL
jgi:hypothetical protein